MASVEPAGGLRFTLVYPPFEDKRDRSAYYVAPPLGLLSIASYLRADGHSVAIHDFVFGLKAGRVRPGPRLYDECVEQILASDPDVVGFGTQCSTGPGSISLARAVKRRRPDVAILLGGHDVSFLAPEYLRAFDFVDFVLAGEAELTAPKLARAVAAGEGYTEVPGLSRRQCGAVTQNRGEERVASLDDLLAPSYDLVDDLESYFALSRRPTILVDSGRGCAFACEFCQTTLLNGRKVRYRSVGSLVAELEAYRRRYPEVEAYFVHDLFTARRRFVEDLCRELVERDLGVRWQCRCRIDEISAELLGLMSRAGCRMLLYGVESGSEQTLQVMNKRLRKGVASQATERVRWTVNSGIFPSLSMVVGIPEESFEGLSATMALAAEFVKIGSVNAFIQLMSPLPGTALARRLEHRLEYRGQDAPTAFSQGIEFHDGGRLPEDEELIQGFPAIFQSFYVVTPDHGDLDICIDVSLAYCKLIEVYCYTYLGIADQLGVDLLSLFRRFRDRVAAGRMGARGLTGIRDHEIWDGFRMFARDLLDAPGASEQLREVFRYEQFVHEISVGSPLDRRSSETEAPSDGAPFRLHAAVRLFRTTYDMPWLSGGAGGLSCLLVMLPDRLEVVRLTEALADAVDLLTEVNATGPVSGEHYRRLARVLRPLWRLGVLEAWTGIAELAVPHAAAG